MKHARPDYDRIQDPAGLIPENEPVFLLRAQDICAPMTVLWWALAAKDRGASLDIVNAAIRQANVMRVWQELNAAKVPDMPAQREG